MPIHISIPLQVEILQEVPQAVETCHTCGESVYFKVWRAWVTVCGTTLRSEVVLCDACKEANT